MGDMAVHELKTDPEFFEVVATGVKTFEIRKNDRNFQVGDVLLLKEYNRGNTKYSGRHIPVEITYLTPYAQQPGYVVLGIKK